MGKKDKKMTEQEYRRLGGKNVFTVNYSRDVIKKRGKGRQIYVIETLFGKAFATRHMGVLPSWKKPLSEKWRKKYSKR